MTEQTMSPEQKLVDEFRRLAEKHHAVEEWTVEVDHCEVFLKPADRNRFSVPELRVMKVEFQPFTFVYDPDMGWSPLKQLEDALCGIIAQRLSGKKIVIRIGEGAASSAKAIFLGKIPFMVGVEGGDASGFEPLPGSESWQFFIPDPDDRVAMLAVIREYYESRPTPCSGGACGLGMCEQ